jgi:PEP-CTERM motif-containing protein
MSLKTLLSTMLLCGLLALPSSAALIINELDSDSVNTPTTDAFEFVELFESTGTSVALDSYVLVYYNGNGNVVYGAEDLDTFSTSATGYFTAGSIVGATKTRLGNTIQNGVDAVALFLGSAADFPNGTAATARPAGTTLIDAVVYKTGADVDGVGLDTALGTTGAIVDEFGRDGQAATGAIDSIGRLPNGSGGAFNLGAWSFMTPTPNALNVIPEPTTFGLIVLGTVLFGLRRRSK